MGLQETSGKPFGLNPNLLLGHAGGGTWILKDGLAAPWRMGMPREWIACPWPASALSRPISDFCECFPLPRPERSATLRHIAHRALDTNPGKISRGPGTHENLTPREGGESHGPEDGARIRKSRRWVAKTL